MKTITTEQQDNLVGEGSFWFPKRAPGTLTYLHGADGFDEIRADTAVKSPFNLNLRPGGLAISIMHQFKKHYLAIPFAHLKSVSLETPAAILSKKEKSVVGRAVLGGVLLGPVGALVGGLSGLKEGTTVTKQPSLLTIVATDDGELTYLVASIEPGILVSALREWLQKNLPAYYQAG